MNLHVQTPGASIKVAEGMLAVEAESRTVSLSPHKVSTVAVGPAASLTTAALDLCLKHGIDLVLLDSRGQPRGRFWSSGQSRGVEARRQQLLAAGDGRGLKLCAEWIVEKLRHQAGVVDRLLRTRPDHVGFVRPRIRALYALAHRAGHLDLSLVDLKKKLLGIEGVAGRIYFGSLAAMLPERWGFRGRSRAPARDPFNCALNYAYGMLYSQVEKAVLLSGLDPYGGFLHAEGDGKMSLVYDLMERYRHWAELPVFRLFSGRRLRDRDFERDEAGGFRLAPEGRRTVAGAMSQRLDLVVRYGGRNRRLGDTMLYDCHRLACWLAGREFREEDAEVRKI